LFFSDLFSFALGDLILLFKSKHIIGNIILLATQFQRFCFNLQGGAVNRGLNWFFFHCMGLHVSFKLMLGLKSTGWCGLDPWLNIYLILT
jgi:hypothetical protein